MILQTDWDKLTWSWSQTFVICQHNPIEPRELFSSITELRYSKSIDLLRSAEGSSSSSWLPFIHNVWSTDLFYEIEFFSLIHAQWQSITPSPLPCRNVSRNQDIVTAFFVWHRGRHFRPRFPPAANPILVHECSWAGILKLKILILTQIMSWKVLLNYLLKKFSGKHEKKTCSEIVVACFRWIFSIIRRESEHYSIFV